MNEVAGHDLAFRLAGQSNAQIHSRTALILAIFHHDWMRPLPKPNRALLLPKWIPGIAGDQLFGVDGKSRGRL